MTLTILACLHYALACAGMEASGVVCAQVKGTLMAWVHATAQGNGTQLPAFLRNKLAQVIVQLVKVYSLAVHHTAAGANNWSAQLSSATLYVLFSRVMAVVLHACAIH